MLDRLLARIEALTNQQEIFSKEIDALQKELLKLQSGIGVQDVREESFDEVEKHSLEGGEKIQNAIADKQEAVVDPKNKIEEVRKRVKIDLEKFIGENLINKIGIAITIIGVGIGVKYSIDHDLVTPLMRVIFGYIAGIVLLLLGIRLKDNYLHYSAVLVSGAMAIMYFITFAAYSFYELMPPALAFGVMVIFTVFTVLAAISYNQEVIALIGLVGAYAVPFLLSSDSGNVKILLSYISIINIGILIISILRYWKILYYSSFILSWMIFCFWYLEDFEVKDHFILAITFAVIFFFTFYVTFLANKLIKNEAFKKGDIIFLIINSFIFYGIGYFTLDTHEVGKQLLGLFTAGNALIHFGVSIVVFRQHLSDKNLFYLIVGMVLVFITLAIPVQLEGRWVTLLWIGEATLLFWIGRRGSMSLYEKLSYPLIFLAFLSLLHDWSEVYGRFLIDTSEYIMMPVFNVQFLSSLIFVACIGFIIYLHFNASFTAPKLPKFWKDVLNKSLPIIALIAVYFSIHLEIANYWDQLSVKTAIEIAQEDKYADLIKDNDLRFFKASWLSVYSLLFFGVYALISAQKFKNTWLGNAGFLMSGVVLLLFLTGGLYTLSELRESYLKPSQPEYFDVGLYNISIRYIALAGVAGLIYANFLYIRKSSSYGFDAIFSIVTHISIIWILSSELIHWLDLAGSSESYKLGLSILWGIYSLFLIALGIWKKKKYLRIMGIIIFAGTLIKLFFYDVSHLETIPKTILFVSLGILLLIISFRYNKYRHIITNEE